MPAKSSESVRSSDTLRPSFFSMAFKRALTSVTEQRHALATCLRVSDSKQ
jgi:hypothetical protein